VNELIKVTTNQQNEPIVSGRELHKFLGITERYSSWFDRMLQYGFMENIDFVGCKVFNALAKQELQDHAMKLDMAKEISMLQRNEKGKQARLYFIEVEKRYKAQLPATYLEALKALVASEEEKQRLVENNESLEIALNQSLKYYTVAKYNKKFKMGWNMAKCQRIGKELAGYCRARGYEIKKCPTNDERFGEVNTYPITVWEDFMRG